MSFEDEHGIGKEKKPTNKVKKEKIAKHMSLAGAKERFKKELK
jgi:hypothetical protein